MSREMADLVKVIDAQANMMQSMMETINGLTLATNTLVNTQNVHEALIAKLRQEIKQKAEALEEEEPTKAEAALVNEMNERKKIEAALVKETEERKTIETALAKEIEERNKAESTLAKERDERKNAAFTPVLSPLGATPTRPVSNIAKNGEAKFFSSNVSYQNCESLQRIPAVSNNATRHTSGDQNVGSTLIKEGDEKKKSECSLFPSPPFGASPTRPSSNTTKNDGAKLFSSYVSYQNRDSLQRFQGVPNPATRYTSGDQNGVYSSDEDL